jgi:preprotein translocase subunit SecE
MAVAEARKMEKSEGTTAAPAWLAGAIGWGPKKFNELKNFFREVYSELKKVTWPSRQEVISTTIVVIVTTVFFGFYLYGIDLALTQIQIKLLK